MTVLALLYGTGLRRGELARKAVARRLPISLSQEQVSRLLSEPKPDTIIGLRDRALLALLYGTGIRASECASLHNNQVDLKQLTITVRGKGGNERVIPLNPQLGALIDVDGLKLG